MFNILTVDFEEWHHPEYVKDKYIQSKRDNADIPNISETLGLLEKHKTEATFFVVGEIAQKHPELIEQIRGEGHEVGFHGHDHEPLWKKSRERLKSEINAFRRVSGESCIGFRAPSFSLNNNTKWALNVLEESEFKYDSSIFPAITPLYGVGQAPTQPYKPSREDVSVEDQKARLWEFPLHVYSSSILRLPMAGGFYLRFFPLRLLVKSIKKANKNNRPAVLFVHTWELNPETPKLKLGLYRSFVTYHNLEKTAPKLDKILSQFGFTSIQNYMKENGLM